MVGVIFVAVVQRGPVNFSSVKVDIIDIFIFAGIILAAIGAIWGIRKMIILGYISSIPGHWQKRYEREQERHEREQDFTEYREFRDSGGFDRSSFGFGFAGRQWQINGFGHDSDDDLEDEFIGSVGDKSYYYDDDGNVYTNFDEIVLEENEDEDIPVFDSYESREGYRNGIMDYIDNKQEFESYDEYIEWRSDWNERIDDMPYFDSEGVVRSGHDEYNFEDDDSNIGWEK